MDEPALREALHRAGYLADDGLATTLWLAGEFDIMSLVKFDVTGPTNMASVLTTESLEEMGLKIGDEVELVVKAIHVLPVKK